MRKKLVSLLVMFSLVWTFAVPNLTTHADNNNKQIVVFSTLSHGFGSGGT